MDADANHPVRTTEKSLALLEKLEERDGARIHELEDDMEMSKGAIHNHLSTLRKHGYVLKEGHEYRLSLKLLSLGGRVRNQYPIYQFGRQKAEQLAEDTGMLVNLGTEENGKCVYLYQARGDYAVKLDTQAGRRLRMHNIAMGKSIMAHLPRERVAAIIDRWGLPEATERTITDEETLFEELETVRTDGYAVDSEERTIGVCCIAAPVRADDAVLGAISITAPTGRLGEQQFEDEIISEVKSTAHEIALNIQYA